MSAKNQIKEVLDKISDEVNINFNQKQMMKIGSYAAELIRIRTRLGYGVPYNGAPREKLLELQDFTKIIRKIAKQEGELSEYTTPNRSNLTFTGQMTESIQAYISQNKKVIVGPKGYRKSTKKTKKLNLKPLSNEQVANTVSKGGRPFNNLSDLEIKKLTNFAEDGFTSAILRRIK